jgi:exodeoxyribonuclease-3
VAIDFGARKGYSGTAVLSRVPPLSVSRGIGVPEFDDEGRAVVVEYADFVLHNIYFPNGGASPERLRFKMAYYDAFLARVDAWHAAGRAVIVVGDVNTAHREMDLARPKENAKVSGFLPEERAWVDQLVEHGMVDTFRTLHPDAVEYSWWDMKTRARERNAGWRIDYVFVSAPLLPRVQEAFVLGDVQGSDHCPVGVRLG